MIWMNVPLRGFWSRLVDRSSASDIQFLFSDTQSIALCVYVHRCYLAELMNDTGAKKSLERRTYSGLFLSTLWVLQTVRKYWKIIEKSSKTLEWSRKFNGWKSVWHSCVLWWFKIFIGILCFIVLTYRLNCFIYYI